MKRQQNISREYFSFVIDKDSEVRSTKLDIRSGVCEVEFSAHHLVFLLD